MAARPATLGLIAGNRRFFPAPLCSTGRAGVLAALREAGFDVVALDPGALHGAVESLPGARACADLFRARRDEIDGVRVTLPKLGDERAANGLRRAGLDVPVLTHPFAVGVSRMTIEHRRDSFCGKMPCTIMSMMSESLPPGACETDDALDTYPGWGVYRHV